MLVRELNPSRNVVFILVELTSFRELRQIEWPRTYSNAAQDASDIIASGILPFQSCVEKSLVERMKSARHVL